MDIDQLKLTTTTLLEAAMQTLVKERTLLPAFMIVTEESVDTVYFDGQVFEDASTKAQFFRYLKKVCRMKKAQAFVMITDSWTLHQTEEQQQRMKDDKAYRAEHLRISKESGVPAVAAAGFGRLMEGISATGQTSKMVFTAMQKYERVAPDGVIPATAVMAGLETDDFIIRPFGEVLTMSSEEGKIDGRMMEVLYEGAAA